MSSIDTSVGDVKPLEGLTWQEVAEEEAVEGQEDATATRGCTWLEGVAGSTATVESLPCRPKDAWKAEESLPRVA